MLHWKVNKSSQVFHFQTASSDRLWWPWICVGDCCHPLWMYLGSRLRTYRIDAAPQRWRWGEFPLGDEWRLYRSTHLASTKSCDYISGMDTRKIQNSNRVGVLRFQSKRCLQIGRHWKRETNNSFQVKLTKKVLQRYYRAKTVTHIFSQNSAHNLQSSWGKLAHIKVVHSSQARTRCQI